jgi:hypothetical protein
MACAKCDFHTPKDSTKAQRLEAKDNLQRMLASIPLTDDEHDAVDDGQAALDKLLDRLADVPTPGQIGISAQATLLPVVEINRKSTYSDTLNSPAGAARSPAGPLRLQRGSHPDH